MFRNTLSGRHPGRPLFGHVKLFLCLSKDCDSSSIRAIFSHTNITGRAIPIYRSDYLPTITSPRVTQKSKISKRRIKPRSLKEPRCARSVMLTERSHCDSVEFSIGLTAAMLRDLDEHEH